MQERGDLFSHLVAKRVAFLPFVSSGHAHPQTPQPQANSTAHPEATLHVSLTCLQGQKDVRHYASPMRERERERERERKRKIERELCSNTVEMTNLIDIKDTHTHTHIQT